MGRCIVISCRMKNKNAHQNITLHRLPKCEKQKEKWLNIVGLENLNTKTKHIFICSLHFEEKCFNRTLNVTRLRDDALPSSELLLPAQFEAFKEQESVSRKVWVEKPIYSISNYAELSAQFNKCEEQKSVSHIIREETPVCSISSYVNLPAPCYRSEKQQTVPRKIFGVKPVCSTSNFIEDQQFKIIQKLKTKCEHQRKKIKRLNEKVRRQSKKKADFKILMKDIEDKNYVNDDHATVLEQCSGPKDFIKRHISKSVGLPMKRQYSEDVRKFALTLHFLSPKVYDFVRRTYNTCLPHPRTLSRWYQNVNAEPGFCTEAFNALKLKAQTSDMPVLCSLVLDEMAIRKCLCWDPQTKTYYGRVNVGTDCDMDSLEVANECLVLLLTCINGSWKLPVGYFFITALSGEQKAVLVKICILKCEEVGVKVVSFTCDGSAANFSMFSTLGCDLNSRKTTFTYSNSIVYAFIEHCHAIKLVRNAFGELRVFCDIYGRKINYIYLEHLLNLQEVAGLHMATKLTKAHVLYQKQIMKVRLATQLLSDSVADALEHCNNLKYRYFKDVKTHLTLLG